MSGPGDVTVVELASSDGQTEAGSADPLLAATGTTRLPDLRDQAHIGSTQVPPLSLSRGSEPVQIPTNILQREPRCQHRKINVTSALSRVESELQRAEITAVVRYQTSKKESPPTIRYSGGHDHQTAAVVPTTRLPLLPSQQLRRYQR